MRNLQLFFLKIIQWKNWRGAEGDGGAVEGDGKPVPYDENRGCGGGCRGRCLHRPAIHTAANGAMCLNRPLQGWTGCGGGGRGAPCVLPHLGTENPSPTGVNYSLFISGVASLFIIHFA